MAVSPGLPFGRTVSAMDLLCQLQSAGGQGLGSDLADPKLLNQFAVEWVEGKLFFSGTLALRRGVGLFP